MPIKKFNRIILGVSLFLAASQASSQSSLLIDVGDCVLMDSAIQRFGCYESKAEAALQGASASFDRSAPAPAPAQAPAQAPMPTPVPAAETARVASPQASEPSPAPVAPPVTSAGNSADDFGLPEAVVRDEEGNVEELLSVVAEIQETVPSKYTFTLENGQVWRMVRPEARLRPRVGHAVRIYPSGWGKDYRMAFEALSRFVQVERIR